MKTIILHFVLTISIGANIALIVAVAGCASTDRGEPGADTLPRVELLGFGSCPNTPIMHDRLRRALRRVNPAAAVEYVDQETLAGDDPRGGYPAPTVLVNGHDLFGMPIPERGGMGCRMYRGPGGVPGVETLERRLVAMIKEQEQD